MSEKKSWEDYPIGTKAHAIMGGYWTKTGPRAWEWLGGSTFPTPGGDAGRIELPDCSDKIDPEDLKPEYHSCGMGCGLEDRNITDRYEAMEHGWSKAEDRWLEALDGLDIYKDGTVEKLEKQVEELKDKAIMPDYDEFCNSAKGLLIGEFQERLTINCPNCDDGFCDDMPCEDCNQTGEWNFKIGVEWTTIKDIYKKAYEYFKKQKEA